jgi:hypothetical protein
MKATATTFLLGALVGAAIALGVRAAILDLDEGGHAAHGGPTTPEEHAGHEVGASMAAPPVAPASTGLLIDLGNERCPIMGGEVNGVTWSEWNGLRIGHCCPPCIEKLLADPEKALSEAGIEWREAARLVAAVEEATGEERKKLLAEARAKYGIVRMPEGEE